MAYPSPAEIEVIYAERNRIIGILREQPVIAPADLKPLDRSGRFTVAAELWDQCNQKTRDMLLADVHHFVRSAALLSDTRVPVF